AKENGCTVILITNNGNSPLAGISDYKIVTATREKLLTEEFWFSRVTATAVMDILYLLLRAGMKESVEHIR
ncbi:SIS domain-containing protein, partial [Eggerthella lenta]|nr:SIS domain-containing protein [Eggerthella lenta]